MNLRSIEKSRREMLTLSARALVRTSVCALLVLGSLVLVAAPASAAPSQGELLFREGRGAMQEKDYDRACVKFAESQKVEPAPGTALNLGECEEQRGHLLAAYEAFTLASSTFAAADKQKYAATRADAVDKRIPRLTVRIGSPVPGLQVHVGAKSVPIDSEVKLDPGDTVIRAEAPGKRPKEVRVVLRESKSLDVDIGALEPETKEPANPSGGGASPAITISPTTAKPSSLRTVGLIVGGVGVASLIVGGVTGVLALGKASTVEEHCDADLACDPEGVDAASSGDTLSLVSTITIAAGAAAVIGGAVLFFVAPKASTPRSDSASSASSKRRPFLLPTASRDGAGVMLTGAF